MNCPNCGKEMNELTDSINGEPIDENGRFRLFDCLNDDCSIVFIKVYSKRGSKNVRGS